MTKEKIQMKVQRKIGYDPSYDRVLYRATVRVYLKAKDTLPKDLALIRLHATSVQGLERKIKRIETRFKGILKRNPKFIKKIGESERILIGEI